MHKDKVKYKGKHCSFSVQSKPMNGRFGPIIGKLEGELLSGSSQKFVEKPFCGSRYSLTLPTFQSINLVLFCLDKKRTKKIKAVFNS